MKLKQLLEQLNQLAKERPEALEMEVFALNDEDDIYSMNKAQINHAAFNVYGDEKYGVLVGASDPKRLRADWSHIKNVVTINY